MKAIAKIQNVDDISVGVTITMSVKDWRLFTSQVANAKLTGNYPFWRILDVMSDAVDRAERSYQGVPAEEES